MSRAITCKACGKTTWASCGEHVKPGPRRRSAVPPLRWPTENREQRSPLADLWDAVEPQVAARFEDPAGWPALALGVDEHIWRPPDSEPTMR